MTGDGPNHQQPRTNKRKGKPDISLVLIKRVNLAFWLGGERGVANSPHQGRLGLWPRVTQRAAPHPLLFFTPSGVSASLPSHTLPGE